MNQDRDERSARYDAATRRANSVFRGMLVVFAIGFATIALVGYIATHEVAVIVLFAVIYGGIALIGFWGKKYLIRDMGNR
ncbi:MAG TPA: hypothetical protein VGP17_14715 [Solirubrobacteraceae bacterium]|nr:hypothetical protein [Solirubrobacteraceae bacterium]